MNRLTKKCSDNKYLPVNHIAVVHTAETSEDNLNAVLEKLGKYEDLKENGLLIKLPFKPGDTIYHLLPQPNGEYTLDVTIANTFFATLTALEDSFGNIVFTNLEEAKRKQQELNQKEKQ